MYNKNVATSEEEALAKAMKYCAYQERCHQEVRTKLLELGQRGEALERIISILIEDNFINEERFASSFVRGKFNLKGWGRRKIEQELRKKQLSDYTIRKGLQEIDEEVYKDKLKEIAIKKLATLSGKEYIIKNKVMQYLLQRGYEQELCWQVIQEL